MVRSEPREGCRQSNIPFDNDVFPTALCPVDRSTSFQKLPKNFLGGPLDENIFYFVCCWMDEPSRGSMRQPEGRYTPDRRAVGGRGRRAPVPTFGSLPRPDPLSNKEGGVFPSPLSFPEMTGDACAWRTS